jgi:hypothetical protein
MRRLLLLIGIAAVSAQLSLAQQAALTGYVKDPSGAVVPKAGITVIRTDTAAKWSTASSDAGLYEFSALPPGPYELHVDKAGFQPLVRGGITLGCVANRFRADLLC